MNPLSDIPLAVRPRYMTDEPNKPIHLYSGPLEIQHKDCAYSLPATIDLEWLRSPHVRLSFFHADPVASFGTLELEEITFGHPESAIRPRAQITDFSMIGDTAGLRYEYSAKVLEPIPAGMSEKRCSAMLMHLANFHETVGTAIKRSEEMHIPGWSGRFELADDEWKITVDKVEDSGELYKRLKKVGGYGITHVILVERSDGREFLGSETQELREHLNYFLSFARGCWIDPFLEVGLGGDGREMWNMWSGTTTEPWQVVNSWFDELRPGDLSRFWPTFRERLRDPLWGEVIKRAIRWYIPANKKIGDSEGQIMQAQAVQELLIWTKFVGEQKLSEKALESLPMFDKLRLMLAAAKIPLEIPPHLRVLQDAYKKGERLDGPKVITEIRNKIVHPSPNKIHALSQTNKKVLEQAHRLSMWYVDLLMLFVMQYDGEYANRLVVPSWKGQTEPVPWSI